jgi:hypothetical protein
VANLRKYAAKQNEGGLLRLDDIAGKPLTILAVEYKTGDYGDYAVFTAATKDGEQIEVMTGASLVMDALVNASAEEAFPVEATFVKRGRTWIIAGDEDTAPAKKTTPARTKKSEPLTEEMPF